MLPKWSELHSRWGDMQYGFAFNDQLNRWFGGGWFNKLAPHGYGIGEYVIDSRSVYVTRTQAIYNPHAKSLKRVKWTPLSKVVAPRHGKNYAPKSVSATADSSS